MFHIVVANNRMHDHFHRRQGDWLATKNLMIDFQSQYLLCCIPFITRVLLVLMLVFNHHKKALKYQVRSENTASLKSNGRAYEGNRVLFHHIFRCFAAS